MANISIDTVLKLPTAQKIMIIAGISIALIGLYVYLIHMPARETLQQRNEELAKLQSKYDEQQKVLANYKKFKKELADMKLQLAESLKLLPNSREIPKLLTNISNLARESGLEILLFQPKPEIAQGFYADIPVEMKVNGKYHNLGYFCDRISKLSRIVNITDIELKAQKSKGNDAGSLEASFNAVTFKFIEESKKSGKKSKKRKRRRK